jgi:hypothetical protein
MGITFVLMARWPAGTVKLSAGGSNSTLSGNNAIPTKRVALDAIRRIAAQLQGRVTSSCLLALFGNEWGHHTLCDYKPAQPCQFYSFGISNDYSFDTDLARKWGCHGFAADPTITHPSKLHPNVTFHSIGAKVRTASAFQIVTSMPALRNWLRHSHVTVLKMDCEGCEYSLGEDIALEDPSFFTHVDQFAVEVHVSKNWLETQDARYSLGLLYYFLDEAGLKLQHAEILGCDPRKESIGCMDEFTEMGYPCGLGKSCHNYLFARHVGAEISEETRGNRL